MRIKALFFDIDGTLVSFQTHRIPASTIEALEKAKANNIRIFISTGRPISIITNLTPIQSLIDGYITANGAYCFTSQHTISIHPMDKSDVSRMIEDANERDYPVIIAGERTLVIHNRKPIVDDIFSSYLHVTNIDYSKTFHDVKEEHILQLTAFVNKQQEQAIASQMPHSSFTRWHPLFADIIHRNISKANGLEEIAKALDLRLEETMAFGDGGNDIPILHKAGIGVAMGNASDDVKAQADYITTSVDEDGVWNALRQFNLIP